jgi:hypothetical protein
MENDTLIFTDPEDGKQWALHPNEQNYMEKLVGLCVGCQHILVQYAEINLPNRKKWLEVNCQYCQPRNYRPYNFRGKKKDGG